jgi:O-succinylbenzoic acid--CoA ligase
MEWIEEARRRQTGWWITSALESNVGLNAIAQWCATLGNPLPQGLGTGELFANNPPLPLHLDPPQLWWKESQPPLWENGWAGQVTTSGATGQPRTLRLRQEHVIQSALTTCRVLGLKAGDKALLCMPMQYIGAMMMVARTIVSGLRLTICRPSGHPLKETAGRFRFAAMLPLQVYNSIATPTERKRLERIEILLIGGGGIDPELERELRDFPGAIYSTYAMTETLSHVGLRRINGPEASPYYRPLPGVILSLAKDGVLVIDAPFATESPLRTNDMAELLPDGRFRILGRKDNVINSGGVKIQAEALEEKLRPFMPAAFAITSQPDPRLGEAIVLLVEETGHSVRQIEESIAAAPLSPYERPRHIWHVAVIPLAGNGKINRAACKALCLTPS